MSGRDPADSGAESSTAVRRDLVAVSCLAGAFFLQVPHHTVHVTTRPLTSWPIKTHALCCSSLRGRWCRKKGIGQPEGIKEPADCHTPLL